MILQETTSPAGTRAKVGLPDGYDPNFKYPLILFFHGVKENGTNLELVLNYGPLRQLKDGVKLSKNYNPIVIHPQLKSGSGDKNYGKEILDHIKKTYSIDTNRIVLMWVSNGGNTGWNMVEDPVLVKEIAAFVSICAVSNNPANAKVIVDDGIQGWACHAPSDTTVPYVNTLEMVEAVNELAQRYVIHLYDVNVWGHVVWHNFLNPEVGVYDWMKYQTVEKKQGNFINFKQKVIDFVNTM